VQSRVTGRKKEENMKVESFRDLRVWQAGMELVEEVYRSLRRAVSLGRQLYALRNALQNRYPTPDTRHLS
jgi:hypothetical protein